ncbi:P-loop containing nucleoside triphosphate hydrolase protein [Mycena latifolia]|nr:P-loop containing nucleoside triphosphate hydrolase protein [Mycena latifolia]
MSHRDLAKAVLGNRGRLILPVSYHIATLASYFSLAQQVFFPLSSNATNLTAHPVAYNATAVGTSVTDLSSLIALLFSFGALGDWLKILAFGGVMDMLRRFVFFAKDRLAGSIWITATFEEYDSSYDWMMLWLSKQPSWVKARDLEVSTRSFGLNASAILVPGEEDEQDLSQLSSRSLAYLPATDLTCSMWYRRRYMSITRVKAKTGRRGQLEEKLHVRIMTRHHRVLNELLREAKKEYMAAAQNMITIFVSDTNNNWSQVASRPKRDINSIILDPGVSELLVDDARDFLESKAWYAARGIPFRRGYLLYGAPGSGKTSIISSIAGELGLDIYIISLSRTALDDAALAELISNLPEKCVALMEDIDAAFTHSLTREPDPSDPDATDGTPGASPPPSSSRLSLSGLLNALDGIAAQEGRILYATTNKYGALDPALCRPGRMDIHVEFKLASKFQARKLFSSFYLPEDGAADDTAADGDAQQEEDSPPDVDAAEAASSEKPVFVGTSHRHKAPKLRRAQVAALAARFADAIPERVVSMAALQGFLMAHKVRPHEAVSKASAWVETEREARVKQEGQAQGVTPEGATPAR